MKKNSIDEVFGEYWHLDWQDLPDSCKQWLIEKNAACGSGFSEALITGSWNRDHQNLSQLSDSEHTNTRRESVKMLACAALNSRKTRKKQIL